MRGKPVAVIPDWVLLAAVVPLLGACAGSTSASAQRDDDAPMDAVGGTAGVLVGGAAGASVTGGGGRASAGAPGGGTPERGGAGGGREATAGAAGGGTAMNGGNAGTIGCAPNRMQRGHVVAYKDKFMWEGTNEAFTPTFVMLGDNAGTDLSKVTQQSIDAFLDEMFVGHGFGGVHVVVLGQWFHIGNYTVSRGDSNPDPRTFDKLKMILKTVYARGGATHLWLWGDHQRSQTSRSLAGGAMGAEEKRVLDEIHAQFNDLPGWTMGYGFDLHEWVDAALLKRWHDYMRAKPNFKHLLGARAQKLEVNQIYDGLDYSSYENHKPDYALFVRLMQHQAGKPSFSEDRFRVRGRDKDLTAEETRVTLWLASMAGGVAGIYGYLGSETGTSHAFPNKAELRTYGEFWRGRFLRDMVRDNALVTGGLALRQGDEHFVYFAQDTNKVAFRTVGAAKKVVAVDARKPYAEIDLGMKAAGTHTFDAPARSDWAIAVGEFCR